MVTFCSYQYWLAANWWPNCKGELPRSAKRRWKGSNGAKITEQLPGLCRQPSQDLCWKSWLGSDFSGFKRCFSRPARFIECQGYLWEIHWKISRLWFCHFWNSRGFTICFGCHERSGKALIWWLILRIFNLQLYLFITNYASRKSKGGPCDWIWQMKELLLFRRQQRKRTQKTALMAANCFLALAHKEIWHQKCINLLMDGVFAGKCWLLLVNFEW